MKYSILLIALLFFSCKKDYQVIIKYEIKEPEKNNCNYCSQIKVTYLENGKEFIAVVDSGWTHSFNHVKHTKIYLKLEPLCDSSCASGYGYVNGGWFYTTYATNLEPGVFEGELPN